jgi:hypothetical protein
MIEIGRDGGTPSVIGAFVASVSNENAIELTVLLVIIGGCQNPPYLLK